jgi:hypothetical protein
MKYCFLFLQYISITCINYAIKLSIFSYNNLFLLNKVEHGLTLIQVMREYEQSKGMDALLFDSGPPANDLDSANGPGAGAVSRPTGFIGYPQPPIMPEYVPFNYPVCTILYVSLSILGLMNFNIKNINVFKIDIFASSIQYRSEKMGNP